METWFRRLKAREHAWRDYVGGDISTPEARKRALFHFNWLDHGILRIWWKNFHELAPGAYRANQPSPKRLAEFKAMGIKTILNLRGTSEHSQYLFEREACAKLGLTLIDSRIYASALASRTEILDLIDHMRDIEKPFVMHCKSGSDRTGFAAILYLHLLCDVPMAQAMKQLHWRHFHVKNSKNGILDLFFDAYLRDSQRSGMSLLDWISTEYDQAILQAEFAKLRGK
ncbi:MAG: protein tyrosine/serine phosphatase [Paracoccaceae bacterium]|jgi:protein tyrosine/serine phosphatase